MPSHWSLVMFTLLVQSAVGSLWCLQIAHFWHGGRVDPGHLKIQILAAMVLVLAGLAAAMAHLGKPGASLQAAKNVKTSWLSREILSVNLFAGLLAVLAVLAQIRPGAVNAWLLLVASLAGGAVLYAMTRVYRLRTVPAWNHAGTPLAFVGSALLLGGLLVTLVLQILVLHRGSGQAAMGQGGLGIESLFAALMGLVLKILAGKVKPCGAMAAWPSKTRQPVLQGAGVGLWMISVLAAGNPVFQALLLFAAAVCLVTGEIMHRTQFYSSYQRVGL